MHRRVKADLVFSYKLSHGLVNLNATNFSLFLAISNYVATSSNYSSQDLFLFVKHNFFLTELLIFGIVCYKLSHGLVNLNATKFFTLSSNAQLHGNQFKLVKPKICFCS
jgi:hypothetical protein